MSEKNYEKDLRIDKHALEIEWEKQPTLFMQYAELEADAQEVKDRAVQKLGITQAEMDAKIRKDPSGYGLGDKVTDTAIKHIVVNSKEYKAAEDAVIVATKKVRIFGSAVTAMEHKKRALTKLTDLYLGGYYSSGGVPKEMKDSISKNRGESIRKRLNRD